MKPVTQQIFCNVAADIIKICKRHDPELNQCITDSVQQLRPALEKGEMCLSID
jgi:hypothetical protein